jgi:hypothetical protein
MENLKSKTLAQLFIIYLRYLVGGAFVFSSIVKILGERFTTANHETAAFGTAFHFFETMYRTGIYWQFLGWAQLIAGGILMTQRFAKLGALMFFPIMLNIFVITISMDFAFTPVITGGMLLAAIQLLSWHWDELRILVNLPIKQGHTALLETHWIWSATGCALFALTVLIRLWENNPLIWMALCVTIGLLGMILGLNMHKRQVSLKT